MNFLNSQASQNLLVTVQNKQLLKNRRRTRISKYSKKYRISRKSKIFPGLAPIKFDLHKPQSRHKMSSKQLMRILSDVIKDPKLNKYVIFIFLI